MISDMPASWLSGIAISRRVLDPMVERVACIHPIGGLEEMYDCVPSPERMKATPPSWAYPRLMIEFCGLLRDERASLN